VPQFLREAVGRNDASLLDQKQGQQRPLPSPAQLQCSPVNDSLDWAQQAEIGRRVVRCVHGLFIVSAPPAIVQLVDPAVVPV